MMLFTKTCFRDLPWLEIAMLSVKKFAKEKIEWHVVVEDQDIAGVWGVIRHAEANDKISPHVHPISLNWPEISSMRDPYLAQQWVKMTAHRVIGRDLAWNWDSDVMALRPFSYSDFLCYGKPVLWFEDFNELIIGGYPKYRKDEMCRIYGRECSYEFMRCMPIALLGKVLEHGEKGEVWRKFLADCQRGNRNISEFCVMGEWAYVNFPAEFSFKNSKLEGPTWAGPLNSSTALVHQAWSWGGVTDEYRNFEKSL